MCGIVTVIGHRGFRPGSALIHAMAETLAHRGPDDRGVYLEGNVGLGARRLSIFDLSPSGHQPMVSADGRGAIVFNGAIYNHPELRDELRARGHRFRSTGDTEVLLEAYLEWGEECLPLLNGMFAFAIHDRGTGTVFAARDRFGIKPLYLSRQPHATILASEIKAVLRAGRPAFAVNWRVAADYLVHGVADADTETFFAGVERVPPGNSLLIHPDGTITESTWWQLPPQGDRAPGDMVEQYADLFEDSVRLRTRSDVPVGVTLSGGMDSTSVICSMARRQKAASEAPQPILAFSFGAAEYDESQYIRSTIEQTGAHLVELAVGGADHWTQLSRVLQVHDEPVHSLTPVVQDMLMGLARERGVKVVLTGDGADETAAGYHSYFRDYWYALLRSARFREVFAEVAAFAKEHGGSTGSYIGSLLRHGAYRAARHLPFYHGAGRMARRARLARHRWLVPDLAVRAVQATTFSAGNLDQALRYAVRFFPLPLYLRALDRSSMAHAVEGRDPFLDHRLVSYTFSLPFEVKLRGPWNKWLLREAMRGRIPESVRARAPKYGFPVPQAAWIRGGLYEPMRQLLGGRRARERGIYRTDSLLEALLRTRRGEEDCSVELIRAVQFELWAQMFEDAGTPAPLA